MSTLIECMVAIAVAGAGTALLLGPMSTYEKAGARAAASERTVRALDEELEVLRACGDVACVQAEPGPRQDGVTVRRQVLLDGGPSGTIKVIVSASHPALRGERSLAALIWVPR